MTIAIETQLLGNEFKSHINNLEPDFGKSTCFALVPKGAERIDVRMHVRIRGAATLHSKEFGNTAL